MITVKELSEFAYCPRAFYLERKSDQGLNSFEIKRKLLFKVKMKVFEEVNKSQEFIISNINEANKEIIEKTFRQEYSNIISHVLEDNKIEIRNNNQTLLSVYNFIWPELLNKIKGQTKLVFSFMLKTGFKSKELWIKLEPKVKFYVNLKSDRFNLQGILPKLLLFKDRAVPFDFKRGKSPKEGIWPSHRIELASYLFLLKNTVDKSVKWGVIEYIDSKVDRQLSLNPMLEYDLKRKIKIINLLISSSDLPKKISNTRKCAHCRFRKLCYNLD